MKTAIALCALTVLAVSALALSRAARGEDLGPLPAFVGNQLLILGLLLDGRPRRA